MKILVTSLECSFCKILFEKFNFNTIFEDIIIVGSNNSSEDMLNLANKAKNKALWLKCFYLNEEYTEGYNVIATKLDIKLPSSFRVPLVLNINDEGTIVEYINPDDDIIFKDFINKISSI